MARVKKPKPLTKRTIGKVTRQLQGLFKRSTGKTILLKELSAMLLYLIDDYASVIYDNNILKVQTDDVFGYDGQNIGPAIIILDIEKALEHNASLSEGSVEIKTIKRNRFSHRHVFSNSSLCFGNGYSACRQSLQDGRLDDFVSIVQQILKT